MIKRSNRNSFQTGFEQISEKILRISFSDEKFVDIDRVYNSERERVWTINRTDADESEVVSCRNKSSPRDSDGVVGCSCSSKDLTLLVILDEETVEHSCYIRNILPVALKCGKKAFDDK